MRKNILFAFAGILLFSFVQCGGKDNKKDKSNDDSQEASQEFLDKYVYYTGCQDAINKATTCEELEKYTEEVPIIFREYSKKDLMTEAEEERIHKLQEEVEKLYQETENDLCKSDYAFEDYKVKERNVMKVMITTNDLLFVNGNPFQLDQLKDEVVAFMTPHPDNPEAPEVEEKHIEALGDVIVSKGMVSLWYERGTSYEMYIFVQNELAKAIKEMRDEFSMRKFGKPFEQLNEEQSKAVVEAIPARISEAEA